MDDERVRLTTEQAVALMVDGEFVHTFRSTGWAIFGADRSRESVVAAIKKHGAELAGRGATAMNHGLVLMDENGPLFIATKKTSMEVEP